MSSRSEATVQSPSAHGTDAGGIPSDAQAVIAAAQAAAAAIPVADGVTAHVIPERGNLVLLDSEKLGAAPRRAKGSYTLATVDSFAAFCARHYNPVQTTVWVDYDAHRIVAVFDDHGTSAAWRELRATLTLLQTPEWLHWASKDGQMVGQREFAQHMEDGLKEIVEPDAATMLELAQTFQAQQSATFRSSERLRDGTVQFRYDEDTTATAGVSGQITIPDTFKLAITPFVGLATYAVTAKLRYRVSAGKLTLGYRLDRPHDVIRDAIELIEADLEKAMPGNVFAGTAS